MIFQRKLDASQEKKLFLWQSAKNWDIGLCIEIFNEETDIFQKTLELPLYKLNVKIHNVLDIV